MTCVMKLMTQIVVPAWLCEKKKVLEDWVEYVLGRSFGEAKKKY